MLHHLKIALIALVLALGVFICGALDLGINRYDGQTSAGGVIGAVSFTVDRRQDRLVLSGDTTSPRHERQLLAIAARHFAGVPVRTEFTAHPLLPADWDTRTSALLEALAATRFARAELGADSIVVHGVSAEPGQWNAAATELHATLPGGVGLDADVLMIDEMQPLAALCQRAFSAIARGRIEFRQSSDELRTSSYAMLDKLIDFSHDCRDTRIAITGHSDASGDEHWNRKLSLNRARQVANYLARGGVSPKRLIVAGAGSLAPIADNDSARGRSLNRRIEFELRRFAP